MPQFPRSDRSVDARSRLLASAGPVFAEQGFRAARVRQICARAGVNLAAVNYHFGGKQGLYEDLVRHCCRTLLEHLPLDAPLGPDATAAQRLHRFVFDFLRRTLGGSDRAEGGELSGWHARLLAREMLDPSTACDHLIEEQIRPLFKRLCAIVSECLGSRSTPELAILCARSIVGQCLFYEHSRPLMLRMAAAEPAGTDQIARLADHIANFSLVGMEGLGRARAR